MRALLLSAYAAQSHRYWQRGLQQMCGDWDWTELALPPRYFSWRVRGNPLTWSQRDRATLEQRYDLIVATSMVDLATLRGLVPALATAPTALYFHENQFAYPQGHRQHSLLEAQMVSLYAALAADLLLFNSHYNRDTFIRGVDTLLGCMPDGVPPGVAAQLEGKSEVLPVPLLPRDTAAPQGRWPGRQVHQESGGQSAFLQRPLRLLWSARFEHDKGGELLAAILDGLERSGLDYELAMTGQQFRNSPVVFARIECDYSHRLVHFGYVEDPAAFYDLQRHADIVLSTASHEFQGLAVLEAVAAGCVPVVPARLVYPELYPAALCYAGDSRAGIDEASAAVALIEDVARQLSVGRALEVDVAHLYMAALTPRYRNLLQGLAAAPG